MTNEDERNWNLSNVQSYRRGKWAALIWETNNYKENIILE